VYRSLAQRLGHREVDAAEAVVVEEVERVGQRMAAIVTPFLRVPCGTFVIFLALPGILSRVSASTPRMIGLASELPRATLASPFHQEDRSSCYEGTKIIPPLATPSLGALPRARAARKPSDGRQLCFEDTTGLQHGPAGNCTLCGQRRVPRNGDHSQVFVSMLVLSILYHIQEG